MYIHVSQISIYKYMPNDNKQKTNLTVEKKDTLIKVVMFECGGAVQQRQRMFHSLITCKHNQNFKHNYTYLKFLVR